MTIRDRLEEQLEAAVQHVQALNAQNSALATELTAARQAERAALRRAAELEASCQSVLDMLEERTRLLAERDAALAAAEDRIGRLARQVVAPPVPSGEAGRG